MTKSKNKAQVGQVVCFIDRESNGYEWLSELPYDAKRKVKEVVKTLVEAHNKDMEVIKQEHDIKLMELEKTLKSQINALDTKVNALIKELAKVGEE